MEGNQLIYFRRLKEVVASVFQEAHPGVSASIHKWKGQEIVLFQEHLEQQVQGRVSEKWFYTHIRPQENTKLPRKDMLNLLSRYVGFEGWYDFVAKQEKGAGDEMGGGHARSDYGKIARASGMGLGGLLLLASFYLMMGNTSPQLVSFCFEDVYTKAPIKGEIELWLLKEEESPIRKSCDESACVQFELEGEEIRFVVKAPYYQSDTIVRKVSEALTQEIIPLTPDDYALMIHYFSKAQVKDWQRRRKQLEKMFAEDAVIFQVDAGNGAGMEMYNKSEFINKLTMPLESLQDVQVLEAKYQDEQISVLRFTQN